MAAAAFAAPSLGRRLDQIRGVRKPPAVAGGPVKVQQRRSVLAMDEIIQKNQKLVDEVGWASYAIIRNTNTGAILLWWDGRAVCFRGRKELLLPPSVAMAEDEGEGDSASQAADGRGIRRAGMTHADVLAAAANYVEEMMLLADTVAPALKSSSVFQYDTKQDVLLLSRKLPEETKCILICRLEATEGAEKPPADALQLPVEGSSRIPEGARRGGSHGFLLLLSDVERAYNRKDKLWMAAIAQKLGTVFSSNNF
eukprot:TRINITY_DN7573_c0_g1_i4.p1 TRINITY_DN7573_c0_g1~~TRINITY_DN7573_c0_g1_i4.p1  ORF type:complete len:254 (-),score=85.61 TRINITY_DN7573_c0_g1_i4:173-934(-)